MIPLLKKVNKVVLIRFTEEHWPDFSKHLDVNAVSHKQQAFTNISKLLDLVLKHLDLVFMSWDK